MEQLKFRKEKTESRKQRNRQDKNWENKTLGYWKAERKIGKTVKEILEFNNG